MSGLMHLTEDKLFALALDESASRADPHVGECSRCQQKLEFFRRYHNILREQLAMAPAPGALARALGHRAPVVMLLPFKPQPDMRGVGAGEHLTVLAAQTPTEKPPASPYVAGFASEESNVVVRVLREEGGGFRLFVLREDPALARYVLLAVPDKEGVTHFVPTDQAGCAEFRGALDVDWENVPIGIVSPTAVFRTEGRPELPADLVDGNHTLHVAGTPDEASLTVLGEAARQIHTLLLVGSDGSLSLYAIEAGAVTVDPSVLRGAAEIRLFS
jgi:hypothetical protein